MCIYNTQTCNMFTTFDSAMLCHASCYRCPFPKPDFPMT